MDTLHNVKGEEKKNTEHFFTSKTLQGRSLNFKKKKIM